MKVLITGGAGFIGSHIVDAYIKAGHQVIVVDNLSSGRLENINPKATFYQADINNYWEIEEIFLAERPELVNHHAAQISIDTSVKNPIYDATVNILGTVNILELSAKHGIKKFIFASTGGALYDDRYIPADENTLINPKSPYGIAKSSCERYIKFYQEVKGLPCVILRYSNVYGLRQTAKGENGVVPIFINKIRSGQSPVIFSSGDQTRDFINVEDVVQANMLVSFGDFVGTLNISSGRETSVKEILSAIQTAAGTSLPPEYQPPKPGEQLRSCLNNTAAREVLGWESQISLQEGIAQLVKEIIPHGQKE